MRKRIVAGFLLLAASWASADDVRVAVASNFKDAAEQIAQRFEADSGHRIVLSFGSTGKHYAQIVHGAPFDVFLAADQRRPELLEQQGRAVAGSRFTYAMGALLLWSPQPDLVQPGGEVLESRRFRYLAIANPRLAPYGRAAREVLQAGGIWDALQGRLVRGENVAQAFQFVSSGNAELGFVARSQVQRPGREMTGSYWEVPSALHTPIAQQAVLLRDRPAARAFLSFLRSGESLSLIRAHGYGTP